MIGRLARLARPFVLTLAYAAREFETDAGFERSASLAYKFILSLVPLLAVALALFVAFAPLQEYSDRVETFLFDALLPPGADRAEAEVAPTEPGEEVESERPSAGQAQASEGDAAGAQGEADSQERAETPEEEEAAEKIPSPEDDLGVGSDEEATRLLTSSEMREYLSEITRQLQTSSSELGLFATLFLFVTTLSLFNSIEMSINRIWKVKKRRPAVRKFQAFWSIVSLGPLLLGASLFLTGQLFEQKFLGPLAESPVADIVRVMVPFFCSFIAIYLVYQFVPYTRVRVTAAIAGALVGATLWELGKFGFRFYLSRAVSFEQIYGALGTIPVLLLWLYLSWTVVIYGAEVAYVWQHLDVVRKRRSRSHDTTAHASLLPVALTLLVEIARRFRDGEPPARLRTLAEPTGASASDARHCLHLLAAAGLIHRVDGGQSYLIARPPASIRLLEVAQGLGEGAEDLEGQIDTGEVQLGPLVRAFERRDEVLAETTLGDLLEPPAPAPSERSQAVS